MDTIGNLNRRVKFSTKLVGRENIYGGSSDTYIESAEVWAGVEYKEVGSDEQVNADQLSARTNAVFTIRMKTGLNTEMRIVYDGVMYKILSLLPDAKRCYMTIETVQLGNLRELSLVQSDGQSLVDPSGNALVWGSSADTSGNYKPPQLVFTDSGGNSFYMQ